MKTSGLDLQKIIQLNLQIVGGISFAFAADWMWRHTSVMWWQLGLLAIVCSGVAFATLMSAFWEIKGHIMRDLRVRRYIRQGSRQKSDGLVTPEAMRDGGLTR